MKTVVLIRHAKSSWDNPTLDDFDRPLNARGQRDAPAMAHHLSKEGFAEGRWISSPAKRALTTAQLMAKTLGRPADTLETDSRLYHAWTDTLLDIIREQPAAVDRLLLFAHNPGLTEMAHRLTQVRLDNLPTCGIFVVSFPISDWRAAAYGKGNFVWLDYPKNHR